MIQIQLKSAYGGYGVACLDQDAKEMHMLVQLLRKKFGAQVRPAKRLLMHARMVVPFEIAKPIV